MKHKLINRQARRKNAVLEFFALYGHMKCFPWVQPSFQWNIEKSWTLIGQENKYIAKKMCFFFFFFFKFHTYFYLLQIVRNCLLVQNKVGSSMFFFWFSWTLPLSWTLVCSIFESGKSSRTMSTWRFMLCSLVFNVSGAKIIWSIVLYNFCRHIFSVQ